MISVVRRLVNRLVNACEVRLTNRNKRDLLFGSLRELVTILFAVVLGVGLQELQHGQGLYDYLVLALAYVAVMLSWWGYHWGTIVGPPETNVIDYVIDCLLLVVYWFLIYVRSPLLYVLPWYCGMFILYWAWEFVRSCKLDLSNKDRQIIARARITNLTTAAGVTVILLLCGGAGDSYWVLLVMFLLICVYRWLIHRIYAPKANKESIEADVLTDLERDLLVKAKSVASNARVHLSGFPVGAAALSPSGEIFTGCNVEFDNYSNTIHAEEAAISALITAGQKQIVAIAVYTTSDDVCFPCGMCRQSLFELGGTELIVLACNPRKHERMNLGDLLPRGFHL